MNQLVHFVTAIAVLRDSSNYFPQAQEERSLGRSVLNTALTILPLLYFSSGVKRVKKKKRQADITGSRVEAGDENLPTAKSFKISFKK